MTPGAVAAALEILLNRYLQLEPAALEDCARLAGRGIGLDVDGLNWSLVLVPHARGVQVMTEDGPAPQVRVRGAPLTLLREAWRIAEDAPGIPQGLSVEGDTELLEHFNAALGRVGFDPEELVARFAGDGAAHRIVEVARGLLGWSRRTASTLTLDTAEYLREETFDLVHRADVERWMDEVDAARERADRIDARIGRLESAGTRAP